MKEKTRQRIGRTGWGLVLGVSLLTFLLPGNYTPPGIAPGAWLAVMVGFLLFFSLGLIVGVGLLITRYPLFFQQFKGVLLFSGLFLIGLRAFTSLQAVTHQGWLVSQLLLLVSVWLFALIGVMPLTLGVYLWRQDRSARLFALTILILIWSLTIYTRWRGPEQTLQDAAQGNLPAELSGLLCLGQLIFVLTPLFFIGHSIRLVSREWTRADTLPDAAYPGGPAVEETL